MFLSGLLLALSARVSPCAVTVPEGGADKLVVGAFNIQVFGLTKAGNTVVMNNIKKIMLAYDVILIQEVRDKSGKSMQKLLTLLNSNSDVKFAYSASARLGRTSSKEQYVYYYKTDKVKLIRTALYNDTSDLFEREPYSVLIEVARTTGGPLRMALTGVHIKPSDAVGELDAMTAVYTDAKAFFNTENVVIMGDMNADCSYVTATERKKLRLFTDTETFWSLIKDSEDTTTAASSCTYDRIIVAGAELKSHVVAFDTEHFGTEFGLTPKEVKSVSDHYPVWVTLSIAVSN
ncbi:deoxyribonuclease-1-like [Haliotis rufescens]|uniref:deoxyribonuclease-1-like n=1 Tax=Haliotis rufescens TaxID=6454 RepID=UPI00201F6C0B|nr:deoxyribonuclease-1-like [Haliotis rufescens]